MTAPIGILERTLRGDLSWQTEPGWQVTELIDLAADQGVESLIWEALDGVTGPASAVRQALDARVRAAAARDLIVQREVRATLEALSAAGVNTIVIKGSALAYTVYVKSWHRPRTDTDLLVSLDQIALAESTLVGCGYTRSDAVTTGTVVSHQRAFERVDPHGARHVIDLHWKIVNPHALADALQFDELWSRRQSAPAIGRAAAVPSLVHSTAIAAIHRLAHHQSHERLIWLYDLRVLTSRFTPADWDALVALAKSRSVSSLCADALEQARARLGIAVPNAAAWALADAAPAEPSYRYLEGPVHKRDVLESDLRTLPTWRARWRLLREHAFPPPAFIRQRYGVKNPLWLPALYLHRLVVGAARWVR